MKLHLVRLGVGLATLGVLAAFFEAFSHSGIFRNIVSVVMCLVVAYMLGILIISELKNGYRGLPNATSHTR